MGAPAGREAGRNARAAFLLLPGQSGGGTFTGQGPETSETFEANAGPPPERFEDLLDELKQWDNTFVPLGPTYWPNGC